MMPIRIQRKRSKGWRMPPNTLYVGRGSEWGNPFKVGIDGTAEQCVKLYAEWMLPYSHHGPRSSMDDFLHSEANLRIIEAKLKGKNLACWCALDAPCHADLLLAWANLTGSLAACFKKTEMKKYDR